MIDRREILDAEGRVETTSYRALGYRMIQMRSYENKFLPKHNLQLMMQRDESWRRRYIEGEWGILEGTIHRVSPLSVLETGDAAGGVKTDGEELLRWMRETCRLHRVLDHGDSSPTACVWFAVDGSGNVFAYREYYAPDRLISDHRRWIHDMSAGEGYGLNLADPSIFFKTQRTRGGKWSVADEYADVRISRETALHWSPGDNNELGTRNRIGEYLAVDPNRVHPITKERGAPRLYFVTASDGFPHGVRNLLKETRAQRREQTGTINGRPTFSDDRSDKIPDHAYDCLRYFIASRPSAAKQATAPIPAGSFNSVARRLDEFNRADGFRMMAREARRRYAEKRA